MVGGAPGTFRLVPGQRINGIDGAVEVIRGVEFVVTHEGGSCSIDCPKLAISGTGRAYGDAWRDFCEQIVRTYSMLHTVNPPSVRLTFQMSFRQIDDDPVPDTGD